MVSYLIYILYRVKSHRGFLYTNSILTPPTMETIHGIESLDQFKTILENNPGQVIIKFGAEWCKPCQQIEQQVLGWFSKMPATVQTVLVDVDESFEIYAYMKSRKMIRGIPVILMYLKGNREYTYDDSVAGSNTAEIDMFFQRCLNKKVTPASNLPFPIRVNVPSAVAPATMAAVTSASSLPTSAPSNTQQSST